MAQHSTRVANGLTAKGRRTMSEELRDLIVQTQDAFRADPAEARATFQSVSSLGEGFRSEVALRDHRLVVDEPESLGGTDTGPNPVELILAALGNLPGDHLPRLCGGPRHPARPRLGDAGGRYRPARLLRRRRIGEAGLPEAARHGARRLVGGTGRRSKRSGRRSTPIARSSTSCRIRCRSSSPSRIRRAPVPKRQNRARRQTFDPASDKLSPTGART